MTLRPALFALLGALLLSGCAAGVADRIAERQAAYDAYPADVQARIARGQIRLGDDQDAVWMVYGDPSERFSRTDAKGRTETWVYKVLGFSDEVYPTVRPVYRDYYGRRFGTYYVDDTPRYAWQEVLRVEFTDGRVSAIQMME